MKKKVTVLAVDLGAESGRVMAAHFDGARLSLETAHRFENVPVRVNGRLHWDILRLWHEVQAGIRRGKQWQPASIGVDSWGVDFGLLDAGGRLLGNPVHYRDGRTDGMMAAVFERVPRAEVFATTGIQFMPINTLYQMMRLVMDDDPQLAAAHTFLTIPDLFNYWLTGEKVCERSNATTTQMVDPQSGGWATEMLAKVGIPTALLPPIVPAGTGLGSFEGVPVIAPACHDTGSAVAAMPSMSESPIYISSGTWSLVGMELPAPILSEAALAANVTNEGGVYGTWRLLKNVMGLWIVQQCRATWAQAGKPYSYGDLMALAEAATPDLARIDPNDGDFLAPGDHPARVQAFCRRTGQRVPQTMGEIMRVVLESLAHAYAEVIDLLKAVSGREADVVHLMGGGIQNTLLNRLTAAATGLPVTAGPIEATAIGNALVQLIALGEIRDLDEGRVIIRRSFL